MVKAVRETGRVLQVGMQGRGLPQFVAAKEKYIDTGVIGKVGIARAWYNSNQGYIKTAAAGDGEEARGPGLGALAGPRAEGAVESRHLLQPVQVAAL